MTTGPGFTALLRNPAPQLPGKGKKRKSGEGRAERAAPPDFISVIILAIANICVGLIESRY